MPVKWYFNFFFSHCLFGLNIYNYLVSQGKVKFGVKTDPVTHMLESLQLKSSDICCVHSTVGQKSI